MRHLTVIRTFQSDAVTLGRVENEQRQAVIVTLEKPWVDANGDGISDSNVSRVPPETFVAKLVFSPHHQRELWQLQGVPGRGCIEFHSGNTVDDSLGCVITGTHIGTLDGKPAVLNGKDGEARFMKELDGETVCSITFIDPPDEIEIPQAAA